MTTNMDKSLYAAPLGLDSIVPDEFDKGAPDLEIEIENPDRVTLADGSKTQIVGAIVKREWWKVWEKDDPPQCFYIIQSWDTAFTKGERSDYSACTTWGLFNLNDDENDVNIILLDAFQKRMEFPELKEKAFKMYKEWEPDTCIIEAKAAGAPLVFEMRSTGLPVVEYTPSRGTKSAPNDKIARLNSVSDVFSSGKVWAPETRWADEVKDQVATFPNADHDDLTDSTVQAIMRFRQGGFIQLNSDEREEEHTHSGVKLPTIKDDHVNKHG